MVGRECSHDGLCTCMTSSKTDDDTRKAFLQSLPWLTSGNLDFRRVNSLEIHKSGLPRLKGDDAAHAGCMPSSGRSDILGYTRQPTVKSYSMKSLMSFPGTHFKFILTGD